MPIVQSDKQQRDEFAKKCNDKFINSLVTAWREGNRLLVRNVINECYSPHMGLQWQEYVAGALLPEERTEFNEFMEGK